MSEFKRGDQIKYDPGHCEVEYGFVTSTREDSVFCRFWSNFQAGQLRTRANSECCNQRDIKKFGSDIPQSIIENWLKYLEA